ncbi:MAG: gas vesicle protein GvpK [Jatrophihabitans sp.]|uniref:gas vesicle protein GvpK n=1 Tax=Jatrophihabitans sp. TaxID=1932789 RepID=UPI003F8132EE
MTRAAPVRIDLAADDVGRGLAELVLVVLDLVRELLERQAIRRVDAGDLTDDQIEALGSALRDAAEQLQTLHRAVAGPSRTPSRPREERP